MGLLMVVKDLRAVPQRALAPGLSVRWYAPGDEEAWWEIQAATGIYHPLPPDLFDREFGHAPERLPGRQFFVISDGGATVGTATAWFDPEAGQRPSPGRLHWVAVVPGVQRRGLGSALVYLACRRLQQLGHVGAYLTTGEDNLPAVNLYLRMGFVPQPRSAGERALWQDIRGRVSQKLWDFFDGVV
jgi:GNAT superfamily N-acetyltransferase